MSTDNFLWLAIGAGFLAVLYGVFQTMALMQKSPGNARMQEIAAAIQEGAQQSQGIWVVKGGHGLLASRGTRRRSGWQGVQGPTPTLPVLFNLIPSGMTLRIRI